MTLKRFGVSLEADYLKILDNLVLQKQFPNRSQAIRHLINNLKVDKKWEGSEEVAGTIVLVYDHHKRDLQNKSIEIQHDFHHLILAVQHVHLDHQNCLETISLRGKANQLNELADRLIALKGMKHGQLAMSIIN